MVLTQIFRSRFKQSQISALIPHLCLRLFCNFFFFFVGGGGGYIWGSLVFLKGLEKFKEIVNLEDSMLLN